jgi:hypothetical protein
VEGARVNGCRALTITPSPSSSPARWAACQSGCCPTPRCRCHPPPLRTHSTCQVEGARVNGCRALTSRSPPSSVPARWAACPSGCSKTPRCRCHTPPLRQHSCHAPWVMSSGGSACQRVSCSHKSSIAVIRPTSVGMVPCRLLSLAQLQMPTQQHHPSETLIDMPSGGSACQRVPCSHNPTIAVINPTSVGMVPCRLMPCTLLQMPTQC